VPVVERVRVGAVGDQDVGDADVVVGGCQQQGRTFVIVSGFDVGAMLQRGGDPFGVTHVSRVEELSVEVVIGIHAEVLAAKTIDGAELL
jgi:hypothetical protein